MSDEARSGSDAAGGGLGLRPLAAWRTARGRGNHRVLQTILATLGLGAVAVFAGLIWMLYAGGDTVSAPILVEAPEGPAKVRPEDRGGMAVPHRDKLVFSRISGDSVEAAESQVQMRAGAEMPLGRPEIPRLEPARLEAAAVVGGGAAQPSTKAGSSKPTQAGLPADQWAIQVAAFQQRRHAAGWMVQAKAEHETLFEGLESAVIEGTKNRVRYYRVRFGPFPDRAAANAKCDAVRAAELNCLLVAPE